MFFKDIADYKTLMPVDAAFKFDLMRVYLEDVDRAIFKKYLGGAFLDSLNSTFAGAANFTALTGNTKTLIGHLRVASANLAMVKAIPTLQVSISQNGINILSTENVKTAFQWQVDQLSDTSNEVGYRALEEGLLFLSDNINDAAFALYKSSAEFVENNQLFLKSAADLARYYSAFNSSYFNYTMVRSTIKKVEDFDLKAVLLPTLFTELKTKLKSGAVLSTAEKNLLDFILPAVANLTVARAISELGAEINPRGFLVFDNTSRGSTTDANKVAGDKPLGRMRDTAARDGYAYLKQLANYLEANKASYPSYTSDPKYVLPTQLKEINDGSRPFFSAIA